MSAMSARLDIGRLRAGPGRAGHARTPRGTNVSLASTATARHDFQAHGLDGMVPASPHACNTEDEADAVVEAVAATRPHLP